MPELRGSSRGSHADVTKVPGGARCPRSVRPLPVRTQSFASPLPCRATSTQAPPCLFPPVSSRPAGPFPRTLVFWVSTSLEVRFHPVSCLTWSGFPSSCSPCQVPQHKKESQSRAVVARAFNPSTEEAEAADLSSRPAGVPGQPENPCFEKQET